MLHIKSNPLLELKAPYLENMIQIWSYIIGICGTFLGSVLKKKCLIKCSQHDESNGCSDKRVSNYHFMRGWSANWCLIKLEAGQVDPGADWGWCHECWQRPERDSNRMLMREKQIRQMGNSSAVTNKDIDGLMQDCSNSSVLAMELLLSCTEPSIYILVLKLLFFFL